MILVWFGDRVLTCVCVLSPLSLRSSQTMAGGLLANTDAGKLPSDPVNTYRLSPWWENLREVLQPRSLRPKAGCGGEGKAREGKKER